MRALWIWWLLGRWVGALCYIRRHLITKYSNIMWGHISLNTNHSTFCLSSLIIGLMFRYRLYYFMLHVSLPPFWGPEFCGRQIGSLLSYLLFLDSLYFSLRKFDAVKMCVTVYNTKRVSQDFFFLTSFVCQLQSRGHWLARRQQTLREETSVSNLRTRSGPCAHGQLCL